MDMGEVVRKAGLAALADDAQTGATGLTLRPSWIGADGFFVCAMRRK
jgi:hypothetical protein